MTPIQNKLDPEPLDSVEHHKERAANIRAEAKEQAQQQKTIEEKQKTEQASHEQVARDQEIQQLEYRAGLVRENETRDMLLDRIRKLREVKVEEPKYVGRNAALQAQFEAEQEAGRAAVARAEAEEEKMRILRAKTEEDDRKRLGTMEPVYRPNEMEPKAVPKMGKTK